MSKEFEDLMIGRGLDNWTLITHKKTYLYKDLPSEVQYAYLQLLETDFGMYQLGLMIKELEDAGAEGELLRQRIEVLKDYALYQRDKMEELLSK